MLIQLLVQIQATGNQFADTFLDYLSQKYPNIHAICVHSTQLAGLALNPVGNLVTKLNPSDINHFVDRAIGKLDDTHPDIVRVLTKVSTKIGKIFRSQKN